MASARLRQGFTRVPDVRTPATILADLADLWPGTQAELGEAIGVSARRMRDFLARGVAEREGRAYVSPLGCAPPTADQVETAKVAVVTRLEADAARARAVEIPES